MNKSKKLTTILIVDDEPDNLKLIQQILSPEYKIRVALNGKEALERAALQPLPELILLDIMMPDITGYEVCQKLKADPKVSHIPVIFVTAMDRDEDETAGLAMGAVDYLLKPISAPILEARVKNHLTLAHRQKACREMVEARTKELENNQKSMIHMLGEAGHYNDTDTGVHIWRMAAFARAIAQAAGWPVHQAEMLELAAPMHDTGKIGIPDSILKAPRKLTDEEWVIMRSHTTIGHKILSISKGPLFEMAADIALCHHEKWAGNGYPNGLKGKEIPASARITAIADVFDALTMRRPYKEPWPAERAFETVEKESGAHFDPEFAGLFLSIKEEILDIKALWDQKE